MFSTIDIQQELIKAKEKHVKIEHALLRQINEALNKGREADEYLLKRLRTSPKPGKSGLNPDLLNKNNIFSIDDIKKICIDYRLRFLDSRHFKQEELPYDALQALKELEKELKNHTSSPEEASENALPQIKLLASAKYFKLEDIHKDPMLFARIDDANYYLIHKWGNDFRWYKKWIAFPFRSILALLFSLMLIGIPAAILLPALFFTNHSDVSHYQLLYLAFVVIYSLFTLVFIGFTFHKKFSSVCWNSPYFN